MDDPIQKKRRHENDLPENPFHDPLRQELGYKLNERSSGCLVAFLAAGVLAVALGGFLFYWLTRGP